MSLIAVSFIDVLLVVGLGAAGFVVVALVCVAVLAALHAVLPAADSGAAEVDRAAAAAADDGEEEARSAAAGDELDTGTNA